MGAAAETIEERPVRVGRVRLGHCGNCVIHVWNSEFDATEVDAIRRFTTTIMERFPQGITIFALVEAGTPVPTSRGRRSLEDYFASFAPRTRAVAHVAEGKGLWASMARSVMTGLQLMRKCNHPEKVFADTGSGAAWIASHIEFEGSERAGDAAELLDVIAAIRACS